MEFSLQAARTQCRLKPELRTKRPRTHLCQVWSSAFRLHGLSAGQSLNSEPKDREHICARFGVQPSGCTDSVQAKAPPIAPRAASEVVQSRDRVISFAGWGSQPIRMCCRNVP